MKNVIFWLAQSPIYIGQGFSYLFHCISSQKEKFMLMVEQNGRGSTKSLWGAKITFSG